MSGSHALYLRALALACLLALSSCSQKVFVVHHPEIETPADLIADTIQPPAASRQQLSQLIVIDPGHGGKDLGAEVVKKPTLTEKNLNLMTAKILEGYLRQMGYRTLLTRRDDLFVSLDKRSSFANTLGSDLFVSVHYNSAPSPKAEGIEVFYYRNDASKDRAIASKELAENVLEHVIASTGAKSRGVKHGNLAVVRKTTMPAVLVEGGFLTNDKELAKIRDPAYIKSLAWGIAQGIQAYLKGS